MICETIVIQHLLGGRVVVCLTFPTHHTCVMTLVLLCPTRSRRFLSSPTSYEVPGNKLAFPLLITKYTTLEPMLVGGRT